jgi:hypothetical protein
MRSRANCLFPLLVGGGGASEGHHKNELGDSAHTYVSPLTQSLFSSSVNVYECTWQRYI